MAFQGPDDEENVIIVHFAGSLAPYLGIFKLLNLFYSSPIYSCRACGVQHMDDRIPCAWLAEASMLSHLPYGPKT